MAKRKQSSKRAKPHRVLDSAITAFQKDASAVRTYVASVHPVIQAKPNKLDSRLAAMLPILEYMADPSKPAPTTSKLKKMSKIAGGKIERITDGKSESFKIPNSLGESFLDFTRSFDVRVRQEHILYRGAMLSLCSSTELLLARLLRHHLKKHPLASRKEDRNTESSNSASVESTVSVKTIFEATSIQELRDSYIEQKVESLLYKSITYLVEFFQKPIGVELPFSNDVLQDIQEIFLHRNLFVHNDGIVNQSYLKKSHLPAAELGKPIPLNSDSVIAASIFLEVQIQLLAFAYWHHVKEAPGQLESSYIDADLDCLKAVSGRKRLTSSNGAVLLVSCLRAPDICR